MKNIYYKNKIRQIVEDNYDSLWSEFIKNVPDNQINAAILSYWYTLRPEIQADIMITEGMPNIFAYFIDDVIDDLEEEYCAFERNIFEDNVLYNHYFKNYKVA